MNTKTLLANPDVLQIEKIVTENNSLTMFVKSIQKKSAVYSVNTFRSSGTAVIIAGLPICRGRALP